MANEFKVKNGIIISGSADIEQNLTVRGTLTADRYDVSIVSSSILYESGSSKFGNTLDDLHEFTGSVDISGSINLNGQAIGTGKLDETTFNSFTSSINTTIKNKLDNDNVISGSIQVNITGTTGYSTFSSSIATTDLNQDNRISSLETASGSIRSDFNSFTSSYTTVSGSLDSRLDVLEAYSGSQLVPSSSMSFRTLQTDVYCKNMSGAQINKGTVVRITGAVGDNPLIGVASLLTEGQSANTLGIATQNIPNDDFGLVITEGVLIGVNTSGMTAGQLIFLGENGTFTTTPPVAPNHGVRLGEVLRDQQQQGSIYVRIDNGSELGEAHDVVDTTTNTSYGDLLVKSGSVWINSKNLNGDYTVTGSLTITQNLNVLGSSSITYVTASQLIVSSSTISVNVFEPAERFGGLKVYDSGSSDATASLLWDSLHNHWVYQNASGSNYSGGMLLSGPRNTGSLGDEPNLISGRIVKSVGGDHIDISIISETGTTITVAGDLVANSITGAFDFYGLVNRPTLVSGSSQILDGSGIWSSSLQLPSGVVSGSSQISYTGITDIPLGIVSGSEQLTGSYDTRYVLSGSITQTTWDNIANKPSGIVSGSEQLTGSYDTRYILSGSITETTWDNIANKPSGIVSGSSQIIGLGFLDTGSFNTMSSSIHGRVQSLEANNYTTTQRLNSLTSKTGSYATTGSNAFVGNENINGNLSVTGSVVISGSLDISNANVGSSRYLHTQGTTLATWSITHNLGYNYPNVTVYDGSNNKVMLPSDVISIDANTTEITFATPEYGYALVSVGGISTSSADRYLHTQTSATGSWVIDHNIGYKYVTVNVYDGNDEQLIPQKITAVSVNRTQIDFIAPTSGNAIITVGGPRSTSIFAQTGSYYNTNYNIGITGSLVVTGDVDAANFNTTSDRKLKTNLVRIEGALDKIEKLNGYTFDWLEEYSEDRTRQIGMIADEVYEVQPELISYRDIILSNKEEKIKLLDYSKVTAILIEAIKELNDKVTKLENKRKKK